MTNKDLIHQYITTGLALPDYQFNKLNPNQLKSYFRQRLIADSAMLELITESELLAMPPEQLAQFINNSEPERLANYLTLNRNQHKDKNANTLGSSAFNKFDQSIIRALYSYNDDTPNTVTYWILRYKQNLTLRMIELMFKNSKNDYRGAGNVMADIIKRCAELNMNNEIKTEFLVLALIYYRSPHTVKILVGDEPFQHVDQKQFEKLLENYAHHEGHEGLVELIDSFKSNKNVNLNAIPDELYAYMVSNVRYNLSDTIKMIDILGKQRLLTIGYPYLYHMIIELRPLEKRDEFISYLGDKIMSRVHERDKPMIYDK